MPAGSGAIRGGSKKAPTRSYFTPNTPTAHHAHRGERCGLYFFVGTWWAWWAWRATPARAPGRCQAAATARAHRRRPSRPREHSKTTSGRRQPALHGVWHSCSARQGTRQAYADVIAREQDGAAATPHRHSLISPRLPRNACVLGRAALAAPLLSADLALRSTLSSLQTASNRHDKGG